MRNKIRNMKATYETKLALLQQKYDLKCEENKELKEKNSNKNSHGTFCK